MKEYHMEHGKVNYGDNLAAGWPIDKLLEESERQLAKGERFYRSFEPKPNMWYAHKLSEVATRDLIRNFAYATDDLNPLWLDSEYARKTRHFGIIAPPTILNCIVSSYELALPGCPYLSGYNAGGRWERFREVHEDDSFVVYDEWKGMELKESHVAAAGPVVITHTLTTYINQKEEVVAVCDARHAIPSGPPPKEGESGIYPASFQPEEYVYADEELEAISRAYEEQENYRRGARTLFWEDVEVGEGILPIVKGPLSIADMAAWFAVHAFFVTSHGGWLWKERKLYPTGLASYVTHPISRIPLSPHTVHLDPTVAKMLTGTSLPFGQGAQMESWFAHLLTTWIGDDGFVKIMDTKVRRPNYFMDTTWVNGAVTAKYVKDGEHLVDIDIWAKQQANLGVLAERTNLAESTMAKLKKEGTKVTAHAKATVKLLARKR